MRILSVTLKNFKTHADQHIEFEAGMNTICGENGAGKTSILEAIAWVLFDYSPYTQQEMIRSRATSCEVAVSFISAHDDRTYEVRRHSTTGYRIFDPQLQHQLEYEIKADVMQWLRQHLGIPPGTDLPRLFTTTIGVPQGTFTADFLKPPRDRKDTFDRILRVEDYQQVAKDLLVSQKYSDAQVNEIRHQMDLLQQELRDWDPLQEQQTQLQTELQNSSLDLTQQETIITQSQTELLQLDQRAQAIEHVEQAIKDLSQQQTRQRQHLQQAEQALIEAHAAATEAQATEAGFKAYQQAIEQIRLLEEQLNQGRQWQHQREDTLKTSQQLTTQLTILQERLDRLTQAAETVMSLQPQVLKQQQLEDQQQTYSQLSDQLAEHHKTHQLLRTQWEAQRESYRQYVKLVELAQAAQQICQSSQSEYQAYLQAEEQLQTLNQTWKQRQQQLQDREALVSQLHHYQLQQAGLAKQADRFQQLTQSLHQLQPQLHQQDEWEHQRDQVQAKLNQFEAIRVKLEQRQADSQELLKRQQNLETVIQQRYHLQASIQEIPDLEQHLDRIGSQLSRIEAARQFQAELQQAVHQGQTGLSQQSQVVQQALTALDQIQRDYPHLDLQTIAPALTQGTALTHQLLNQLEAILNDISKQVSVINLKTQRDQLKHDLQQRYQSQGLVDEIPTLETELTTLQTHYRQLEDQIANLNWELEAEATFNRQMAEIHQQLQALDDPRAQSKIYQQELQQKPQFDQEWQASQSLIAAQTAKIASLDQKLATSQHVQAQIEHCHQIRQQHQDAYQRYLQAASEASTLPQRQTEQHQAQERLAQIEQDGKQAQQAVQQLEQQAGTLETLTAAQAEITQQLRDLGDPRSQTKQLQHEIEQRPPLEQQYEQIQTELHQHQQTLAHLNQQLTDLLPLQAELTTQQQHRDQSQPAYERYLKAHQQAQTVPECQTTVVTLKAEVTQLDQQLQHLTQHHTDLATTYDAERHEAVKQTLKAAELAQARIQTRIQSLRPQLDQIQTRLDHLQTVKVQLNQVEQTLKDREKLHRFIKFSRDVYRKAGPRITKLYLDTVNLVADQLFREILNRPMMALNWEPDYDISIQDGGNEKRRFVSLSGGEQMTAALAVRLALLKVLGDLEIAFFDEPTTNMDQHRRQRLAEAITNLKSFEQLFVISHDDTFEQVADHVIRIEREDQRYGA